MYLIFFLLKSVIFNQCFSDHSQAIVIIGNWSNHISNKFFFHLFTNPVVLLDSNTIVNADCSKPEINRYKYELEPFINPLSAEKFIVYELDQQFLESSLSKLRSSRWWNVYAFFLIKNIQMDNSCQDAYFYLKTVWKFNILNVIFMCNDSYHGLMLYTYNPYTMAAPKFWNKRRVYVQNNGNPLVLFSRLFHGIGNLIVY